MPLPQQPLSDAQHRGLVVLLHAFRHSPRSLDKVARVIREQKPHAHIVRPPLPLSMFSLADLDDVASDVVAAIEEQIQHRERKGWPPFDEIVLVGHSTGSMISRKAYVLLWGETAEAPFKHHDPTRPITRCPRKPWANQVTRIVQLAGMNGGWSVTHHMGLRRFLEFSAGSATAHAVLSITGRRLAIDHIRRGAPFLTALRLQWLAMLSQAREEGRETATVVQLLGTVDDLVSPDDNLDLVTGSDFLYLDVPKTGHVNIVEMDDSDAGRIRRDTFVLALTGTTEELRKASVVPTDPDLVARRNLDFTDVVFVVHGIRDTGYWTHKIARRVQAAALASTPERRFATVTSTYGYFPMLSFLLPWRRREKVGWLMDQYVRAKSLYPNATTFSYVGHSNGTYLLASALRQHPACRFDHVVFAGSVVRTDYDWKLSVDRGQVRSVLNYVANDDKVVACFPGALEQFGMQDLGSAGHLGFQQARERPAGLALSEVRFVDGGHGAALAEEHWDDIAAFVTTGSLPPRLERGEQNRITAFLGTYPWLAWAAIFIILAICTWAIWQIPLEGIRVLVLIAFGWLVFRILSQF